MESRRRRADEETVRVRAFVAPDQDDAEEVPVIRVVMRPVRTTVVAAPYQLQLPVEAPDRDRRS